MKQGKEAKDSGRRRRIVGRGALRRDPALAVFADRGPSEGTFLDRRRQIRDDQRPVDPAGENIA